MALRIVHGEYGLLNCRNRYSAGKNSVWVATTSHSLHPGQTQPDLVYTSGRKLFWFFKHIPFPSAGVFWKDGLICLSGLCPCWEVFWIIPIYSLWMNANQQSSSLESEVSKPSAFLWRNWWTPRHQGSSWWWGKGDQLAPEAEYQGTYREAQ